MSRRVVLWCLFILLPVLLGGCNGDSPTEPGGSVETRLALSSTSVSSSGKLDMTLVTTNRTTKTVRIELWGCLSNFQIYRGSELVWDLAPLVLCPQGMTVAELEPGESLNHSASWSVRDIHGQVPPPGQYEARGYLQSDPRMSTPAVSFRVEG